jgi:hypothetical protein
MRIKLTAFIFALRIWVCTTNITHNAQAKNPKKKANA